MLKVGERSQNRKSSCGVRALFDWCWATASVATGESCVHLEEAAIASRRFVQRKPLWGALGW